MSLEKSLGYLGIFRKFLGYLEIFGGIFREKKWEFPDRFLEHFSGYLCLGLSKEFTDLLKDDYSELKRETSLNGFQCSIFIMPR